MVMSKFNCIGANWREVKGFGLHLLDSRWFMFFATLLIMSVNGSSYMFGLYSNDIKSSLGYDQTTLNLISFFKDLGGNLGVLARLTYEVAPPWIFLLSGSIMNFFGFFMIWLSVSHRLGAKPHVWQMCLYMLIGANSESFPNTGALVTCVKNFPKSRGIVIGLLKGLIGLSGAIMTQIYHAVNGDNTKALILLLACLPTIVPIVFIPTIRIIKIARPGNELKVFYSFLYILLVLAGFIMVTIIIQNKLRFTRSEYIATASVVVALSLFIPLAVGNKLQAFDAHYDQAIPALNVKTNFLTLFRLKNVSKKPERGDDYALLQAIFSIDMLILFTATTCSIGGTLAAIDNMGQIGKTLGYPTHSIATKYKFPCPLLLTLVILFSCIGYLLIAFAVHNSVYFASIIIGFCLGAQFLIGSYIFNVRVAGRFYDREALKQGKDNLNCIGARCYRVAFVTISAATFFACIVSIILVLRTKNFYQGDIYNKFKDEAKHIKNNDVSLTRDCVVPMKDMEAKANIGRAAVIDVAAENEHTSNATIDRR
ncbi:Nodulin-like domain-containing protein [Citrus sinensis]|nr:Nodulin-like domain-containing protein [Citrus sinensis]